MTKWDLSQGCKDSSTHANKSMWYTTLTKNKKPCCCLVAMSCPTLLQPHGLYPPGSSVHGISQARIMDWIAISSSRVFSQPRDQTFASCTAGWFFILSHQGSPQNHMIISINAEKALTKFNTHLWSNSLESGHRGNLLQHNKGHIQQTHSKHHSQWWKTQQQCAFSTLLFNIVREFLDTASSEQKQIKGFQIGK